MVLANPSSDYTFIEFFRFLKHPHISQKLRANKKPYLQMYQKEFMDRGGK